MIWHCLCRLPFFRENVAESARQDIKDKSDGILRNLDLVASELRKALGRKLELVASDVGDLRKDLGRNLDLVASEVGDLRKDLGGLIIAVGKPRYVDYSPGPSTIPKRGKQKCQ